MQTNQTFGLNGFWGDLWNGFKEAVGLRYNGETLGSQGGAIGRRIGGFLNRLLSIATAGVLKITDYVPTAQELLVLNYWRSYLSYL